MIKLLSKKLSQIKSNEVVLNTAWQFFERFFGLGCSFISSIFVIRYFAPAEYGIFAYASSYVTLFSALCTMGLQSIAVREMVKKDIPIEEIMGSSFVIMLVGAIIAAAVAIGGAIYTHEKSLTTWVILILCLVNIVNSFAVINYYFQAEIKSRYIAYVMLAQDIIDICIKLTLVHLQAGLISFALIGLIEAIFVNIAIYLIFRSYSTIKKWAVNFTTIGSLLSKSAPIALTSFISSQYMRLDQIILEHYKGFSTVASYSVSVKLIEIFYIIPTILAINAFPQMTQLYIKPEKKEFFLYIKKAIIINLVSSIIISFAVFMLSDRIITLLYGHKYKDAIPILRYGSLCIIPFFLAIITECWIQIKSLQNYSLYKTIFMLLLNISLCTILIPLYGSIGAIASMVITYFVSHILVWIMFKELREICFNSKGTNESKYNLQ